MESYHLCEIIGEGEVFIYLFCYLGFPPQISSFSHLRKEIAINFQQSWLGGIPRSQKRPISHMVTSYGVNYPEGQKIFLISEGVTHITLPESCPLKQARSRKRNSKDFRNVLHCDRV